MSTYDWEPQQALDAGAAGGNVIPDDHPWRDADGNLQCQACGELARRLDGNGVCRDCDALWDDTEQGE